MSRLFLVRHGETELNSAERYWGRSDVKFDKRIEMDAYYARKQSIWLDVLIFLKTPWIMITGKGAV